MKELPGLTGLRFLAAMYVFVFHMQLQFGLSFLPGPLANVISQGALGVNVFFVLSGFILTYTYLKDFSGAERPGWRYYRHFLLRRAARIYPAYLVGFLCCVLISVAFQFYPKSFPWLLLLDATMLESYVPWQSMKWFGDGGWSVSTEFFFYLLFPLLLTFLLRIASEKRLLVLLAVVVAGSSLVGACYTFHQHLLFELTYSFPPSRLPEFGCGVLLGVLVLRHNFRMPGWAALALVLLAGYHLATAGPQLVGYTIHNVVVVPAIMATICVLTQAEKYRWLRWVASRPMRYLGRISYSFYVTQIPLMLLVDALLLKKIIYRGDAFLVLLLLLANVVTAVVLYEMVEKKAHHFILAKLLPPLPPPPPPTYT